MPFWTNWICQGPKVPATASAVIDAILGYTESPVWLHPHAVFFCPTADALETRGRTPFCRWSLVDLMLDCPQVSDQLEH
jgi:hypothetical protein